MHNVSVTIRGWTMSSAVSVHIFVAISVYSSIVCEGFVLARPNSQANLIVTHL